MTGRSRCRLELCAKGDRVVAYIGAEIRPRSQLIFSSWRPCCAEQVLVAMTAMRIEAPRNPRPAFLHGGGKRSPKPLVFRKHQELFCFGRAVAGGGLFVDAVRQ